jgi:hypothetical protein
MMHFKEGFFDIEESKEVVTTGNGDQLVAINTAKLNVKTEDIDGKEVMFVLHNVKHVPGLWKNIFSVGKALNGGATLEFAAKI